MNDLCERWLNPPEWTRREPEVVPLGMDHSPYPDRILPRDGFEKQLAQRTLTKLYNERPVPGWRKRMKRLTPRWPLPTAGPTTRRKRPTKKSCGACWR